MWSLRQRLCLKMTNHPMNAQLHLADCLEFMASMPSGSVDAIISDPPAAISFMGHKWDSNKGGKAEWIGWMQQVMTQCLRVLKPGAHAVIWALPRTSHWTATAIEDAGFEIRDVIMHLFGTGFPKSHNLKGDFKGWGTALKPACEHWILARKPLEGTVADNMMKYGTGAINIDGCRIGTGKRVPKTFSKTKNVVYGKGLGGTFQSLEQSGHDANVGRWPANLTLDEESSVLSSVYYGDISRFFYTAKASKSDRTSHGQVENSHPTVKSTALMRWLAKLVTPPQGTILDPFMGSGSTGVAAVEEGFGFIGIEQEKDFFHIAVRRLQATQGI